MDKDKKTEESSDEWGPEYSTELSNQKLRHDRKKSEWGPEFKTN